MQSVIYCMSLRRLLWPGCGLVSCLDIIILLLLVFLFLCCLFNSTGSVEHGRAINISNVSGFQMHFDDIRTGVFFRPILQFSSRKKSQESAFGLQTNGLLSFCLTFAMNQLGIYLPRHSTSLFPIHPNCEIAEKDGNSQEFPFESFCSVLFLK